MHEGGGHGAVCMVHGNRFYLPSGQMFLQVPAVKIPLSLQVPEALVTWKSICTLGTEINLVLYTLQKLPYRFLILAHSKQWKILLTLEEDWMFRKVIPAHKTVRHTVLHCEYPL